VAELPQLAASVRTPKRFGPELHFLSFAFPVSGGRGVFFGKSLGGVFSVVLFCDFLIRLAAGLAVLFRHTAGHGPTFPYFYCSDFHFSPWER
jgi:hypothetical protein